MEGGISALEGIENWKSHDIAVPYIRAIFPQDTDFQFQIVQSVQEMIPSRFSSLGGLIQFIEDKILKSINSNSIAENELAKVRLKALHLYEKQAEESINSYQPDHREFTFWPNPTRTAKSIYETFPITKNIPLIDRSTPISSAGSCFAYEIAYSFQRRGFNYVVTERNNDQEGLIPFGRCNDGGDKDFARFSANWGLLFNTANLRQMAERAFGVRELPKILVKMLWKLCEIIPCPADMPERETPIATWLDPFREDVRFNSIAAYEKNYPLHTARCREALMKAKVFIATLGLSEAWEVIGDGAIISHNPEFSQGLAALTRPKLLTVKENIENIQAFIDIVRKHNPEMQFILTLSPISLAATFRYPENHVITADGYSKANLRVAIEHVVNANRGVHYFPSYEYVNRCVKSPWDADERHVTRETVQGVMKFFDLMFVKPEEAKKGVGPSSKTTVFGIEAPENVQDRSS